MKIDFITLDTTDDQKSLKITMIVALFSGSDYMYILVTI